ncbi:MAG: DUF4900 domain-containing protein [Balneolaceae bacterium]|nr:DUF4900 domain-containing protein [Balneolaceae bacterium]
MGRSLLFLVSGLTIITGIVQVNNQERLTAIPVVTTDYYKAQQARNLSKSLIDNAVETMKDNNNWTGSIDIDDVVDTKALVSRSSDGRKKLSLGLLNLDQVLAIEEELEDQLEENTGIQLPVNLNGTLTSYTQNSQDMPNNSVGSWDEYKVLLVSSSTYDDVEVTTEVLMQRDSFSKYSYMTQSELGASGNTIWFMDADNIYGPIHTNGEFAMSGSPSFYGLVTSPNMWRAHETNPTSPNFYGGENFNAPRKDEPTSYEVNRLVDAANDGGKRYSGDIDVDFYYDANGGYADISYGGSPGNGCANWMWWCTPIPPTAPSVETVNLANINGVISTDGEITVEGNVNGDVTLHSEDKIEIIGDIVYKTSPLDDSTSTDLLGLVSEGNVIVDRYAHTASGTQDLTVHASIVALNTSFTVENYNSGGNKGTLNMLGGIIQQNRGPVGTFSGNTVVSGYSKNYQYDNRLKASIPPSFPRESVFSIVYWKDEVTKITE